MKKTKLGKERLAFLFLISIAMLMVFIAIAIILFTFMSDNKAAVKLAASPAVIVDYSGDLSNLSKELLALPVTNEPWTKIKDDPKSKSVNFISTDTNQLSVYKIDPLNILDGYKLKDFDTMWIDSNDADFIIVINMSGAVVDLSGYYILIHDESTRYAGRVIINCYEAKEVILNDTIVTGTILAPNAKVTYKNTYVYGQVLSLNTEGEKTAYVDTPFIRYLQIKNDYAVVDIKNLAIKEAAIKELKNGKYAKEYETYTSESKLIAKDVKRISLLNIDNKGIEDLQDIKYFTNLITLICSNNKISKVNLTGLNELQILDISTNQVTELDLSQVQNLETLNISNNQVTTIDTTKTPYLTTLVANKNALTSINISNVPDLTELKLNNNMLQEIDLSKVTGLKLFCIESNSLTSLDVSKNILLENVNCNYNNITTLDFSMLDKVTFIQCYGKELKQLNIKGLQKKNLKERYFDSQVNVIE